MGVLKSLVKYLVLFLVVYFSMTALIYVPAVKKGLVNVGNSYTEGVVNTFYPKLYLSLNNNEANAYKTIFSFQNQEAVDKAIVEARRQRAQSIDLDTKFFDFQIDIKLIFPLLFLLSLIVVSPIPWKRKGIAAAIGFVAMFLFLTAGFYFITGYNVANANIGIYELSDTSRSIYKFFATIANPVTDMTFGLLLWILLCFKKEDFKTMMNDE